MKTPFRFVLWWQHTIPFTTLAFVVMLTIFYATSHVLYPVRASKTSVAAQAPVVSVKPQQDSPLSISLIEINVPKPLTSSIKFSLRNNSDKAVRAYAIRHDDVSGQTASAGVTLINMTSLDDIFQPFQSKFETLDEDYTEPVTSITLSVDFVEFVDGSVWGLDTYKSAQRLDGQRAGARAMKGRLSKLKERGDLAALLKAVTAKQAEISIPPGHSIEWEEGFRTGAAVIHNRLKRAKLKGGLAHVESELQRPFDTSEGGQH